jgi:hypothetical protein
MRLVCGVGINDASYLINPIINGKHRMCPIYKIWSHMLERCYSLKRHLRSPTYIGCTVSKEWLTFSNFSKWAESKDCIGMQLDKDILHEGNKTYSASTCCFVSPHTNGLFKDRLAARGEYLIGVHWINERNIFKSQISIFGRVKYLGYFKTEIEAHLAWRKAKAAYIIEAAFTQTQDNVREALLERARVLLDSDK